MVVEYNPQEWGRGGPTGGAYRPHATLAAQAGREIDPLNGKTLLDPLSQEGVVVRGSLAILVVRLKAPTSINLAVEKGPL